MEAEPSSSSAAMTSSTFLVIESFITRNGSYMFGSGFWCSSYVSSVDAYSSVLINGMRERTSARAHFPRAHHPSTTRPDSETTARSMHLTDLFDPLTPQTASPFPALPARFALRKMSIWAIMVGSESGSPPSAPLAQSDHDSGERSRMTVRREHELNRQGAHQERSCQSSYGQRTSREQRTHSVGRRGALGAIAQGSR